MTHLQTNGHNNTDKEIKMAMERRFRKLETPAMPSDKYVAPLYSRTAGFSPIVPGTMPKRTRGAGDPNYTKKMKTGQPGKPLPKK
jgi:hypothetical protein